MVCLALELLGWSLVSVYLWRLLGELLSINVPWNQEFCDVLKFAVKPPASRFQSYSYSSFKTSPSISTNDKTSRLMVKQFSTARDTQRVSRSCIGKRRRRRERGDQEEKRESQNGREQSSQ